MTYATDDIRDAEWDYEFTPDDDLELDDEPPHYCYMGHLNCWDDHTMEQMMDEADWESEHGL